MNAEEVQGDLRYEISDEREELCPWETSVSIVASFPPQHKIQIWILPSLHGHHPNSQIAALPFQHQQWGKKIYKSLLHFHCPRKSPVKCQENQNDTKMNGHKSSLKYTNMFCQLHLGRLRGPAKPLLKSCACFALKTLSELLKKPSPLPKEMGHSHCHPSLPCKTQSAFAHTTHCVCPKTGTALWLHSWKFKPAENSWGGKDKSKVPCLLTQFLMNWIYREIKEFDHTWHFQKVKSHFEVGF